MEDIVETQKRYIETFDKVAPSFGTSGPSFFDYFGERLVDLSEITSGEYLLDVACGRGSIIFPAAGKVGPKGGVIAVDLAPGMIRETLSDIKERDLKNIEIMLMDAAKMSFKSASFDALLCGFAIFFFSGAMEELFRVIKKGGRISLSLFDWESGYMQILFGTLASHLSYDLPHFEKIDVLKNVCEDTGFTDIRIIKEEKVFHYQDKEEWWTALWSLGTRGHLESMQPETLAAFKADVFGKLDKFMEKRGLFLPIKVHYVLGVKP